MKTIAVLGTLDTKAEEHAFVADVIRARGHGVLLIDVGTLEPPRITPDIPREEVAGEFDLGETAGDRGRAVAAMAGAAAEFTARLQAEHRIDGIISLGGGGGTAIGTAAMRALPLGFPKLMVSTLAAGNVEPYLGTSDIVMFPSIVDVSGLNRLSRLLFTRAAGAICGMVESEPEAAADEKPLIVASMFGNTTDCVNHARGLLEDAGCEVLVFHATGAGGRSMEALIASGMVAGVLDITTTELADELAGGVLRAGPDRLNAAARAGIPAVVCPGCLDMVNFQEPASVPACYAGRTFYEHNPQVTLMRTNAEECAELGRILADKVNAYTGPVTVLFPLKAISVISAEGRPFYDPEADAALRKKLREHLADTVKWLEMDCAINDPEFAEACVDTLLRNMG